MKKRLIFFVDFGVSYQNWNIFLYKVQVTSISAFSSQLFAHLCYIKFGINSNLSRSRARLKDFNFLLQAYKKGGQRELIPPFEYYWKSMFSLF